MNNQPTHFGTPDFTVQPGETVTLLTGSTFTNKSDHEIMLWLSTYSCAWSKAGSSFSVEWPAVWKATPTIKDKLELLRLFDNECRALSVKFTIEDFLRLMSFDFESPSSRIVVNTSGYSKDERTRAVNAVEVRLGDPLLEKTFIDSKAFIATDGRFLYGIDEYDGYQNPQVISTDPLDYLNEGVELPWL